MSFDTKEKQFTPDELLAGNFPIVTQGITLVAGTAYPRGAALGTVDGVNYKLAAHDAADGSEKIVRVLMDPIDATTEAKTGTGAMSGDFNNKALTFGGSSTVADFTEDLVRPTIFIHKAAAAVQP